MAGFGHLQGREFGEILLPEDLYLAVGAVQVNILGRVVFLVAYHRSGALGLIVTAGAYLRFTEALLFAQGAQVHGGGAVGRLAPEHLESLVEDGKVLLTVHQDAASRLEELPSFADGYMVGGAN